MATLLEETCEELRAQIYDEFDVVPRDAEELFKKVWVKLSEGDVPEEVFKCMEVIEAHFGF